MFISLAVAGSAVAVAACGSNSGSSSGSTSSQPAQAAKTNAKPSGDITVWVDSVRLPAAKAYTTSR